MEENQRYRIGWTHLEALDAKAAGEVQEALKDIAPDLGRFIVEFAYGDIFSRPGLEPKSRQIVTISALAALGNAAPQLKFHIGAALNIGVTPKEIIETIYVVTVFAGFPAGLNAVFAAREVFESSGVSVEKMEKPKGLRRDRGLDALAKTSQGSGQDVIDSLADIAPELAEFILDFSYGDVISRSVLSPKWKEYAMIAAGVARGTMQPQVRVHVKAAINVGCTKEELVELMYQMAVYAGFPAALNGVFALKEIFREMEERQS